MSSLARHRFTLAFLAVVALALFAGPLLRREVFVVRDHFDYFQPLRWFTAEQLRSGQLPLWNPYSASGEPWLANPQTGVFYPPFWIFLIAPFATAYMLYLFAHLLLLGWGAYLLFARRAAPGAALAGAAALMVSGPVLSLLDVSNNFASFAWLPLVLWCAGEGAWRRAGVVLAMTFLAGEPFFAAFAALLYVVVRRRMDVIGTAAIAFGVSAVQLLPFVEFVLASDRIGSAASALAHSMRWRDWLRVAVPPPLGLPFDPALGQRFIPVVYVGIIVCALALVGLIQLARRREVLGWLALLGVAVVISTGPLLLLTLPVTLFRYPARLVPFGAFAIIALAVVGWDRLRPEKRWADLVLVLVITVDVLVRVQPLLVTAPFRTDVVPYRREIGARSKFLRNGAIDPERRAAWIAGYLNLYDRRFDAFTAAPLASAKYVRAYASFADRDRLSQAGVGFVVSASRLPQPLRRVATRTGIHVYQNKDAYPMATFHGERSGIVRSVHSWSVSASAARVTVDAAEPGLVVLRQQVWRGWRVSVDGVRAEPLVIDGVWRAVRVPRGRHELVWRYVPASLLIGAAMTFVTLVALQLPLFVKRSRAS